MVELQETGEGMINESHYASDLIRVKHQENVSVSWYTLFGIVNFSKEGAGGQITIMVKKKK